MTQEEIKKILPHRDNMLLVDEAELCEDEKDEQGQPTKCRGSYTITGEEIECKLLKVREPFYFAQGKGYVGGKLCVSGEFSFACIKD